MRQDEIDYVTDSQAIDHISDGSGQDQMERLFAEPDFLTNAQRPLPMTAEEQTPFSQELCDRQKRHKARLRQRHNFARAERRPFRRRVLRSTSSSMFI